MVFMAKQPSITWWGHHVNRRSRSQECPDRVSIMNRTLISHACLVSSLVDFYCMCKVTPVKSHTSLQLGTTFSLPGFRVSLPWAYHTASSFMTMCWSSKNPKNLCQGNSANSILNAAWFRLVTGNTSLESACNAKRVRGVCWGVGSHALLYRLSARCMLERVWLVQSARKCWEHPVTNKLYRSVLWLCRQYRCNKWMCTLQCRFMNDPI